MIRLLVLIVSIVFLPIAAAAQTSFIQISPGALAPRVLVFPTSAVNGAGVIGTNLTFSPDNTFTIGTTSNGRPSDIHTAAHIFISNSGFIGSETFGGTLFPADGVIRFSNNAGTGFTRAIFGTNDGTANGFSFVLSGGQIETWTGDGTSARVDLKVRQLNVNGLAAVNLSGQFTSLGGINTTGFGVPPIVASYETTGNSGAVTNAINYTPAAASSTYEMIGVVNVTAWTTPASFTVTITYKDASGNSRTDTALVIRGSTGATAAAVTAVDRWYFNFPAIDIDNSATAITLSTTGTFTGSPVYNLQGTLRRNR